MQQLEDLIRLVKKGDHASLTELRNHLGKTSKEIADKVGVSEQQLGRWELGEQQPSNKHYILWKIKLSDCIDEKISTLIGTSNPELVTHFWEILWRLDG